MKRTHAVFARTVIVGLLLAVSRNSYAAEIDKPNLEQLYDKGVMKIEVAVEKLHPIPQLEPLEQPAATTDAPKKTDDEKPSP